MHHYKRPLPKVIVGCFVALTLLTTLVFSTAPTPVAEAQSAPPDLPLLAISDLEYGGAFRLARHRDDVSTIAWSNARIAIGENSDSLFITSHVHDEAIGEYPITEPSFATTLEELPVTGPPIQNFASVIDRAPSGNPQALDTIGGMYLLDGSLLVNAYEFYDAPGDNSDTTMALTDASDLSGSAAIGWEQMNGVAHSAGWMSPVPAEWQAALGATHISGFSSGIPIISRASVGPSAFGVNLDPSLGSIGVAEPLLDFDLQNGLAPESDLQNQSGTNDIWTSMSGAVYGFIVPGTSTYLTIGRSAGHETGITYGGHERGRGYFPNESTDMSPFYWLWDVDDLVAVRNGQLLPHEVRPYDHGPIDLPFAELDHDLWPDVGGAAYDPATGRLYITLSRVDRVASIYSPQPVVLTYTIGGASGPVDPVPVDPDPVDPVDPDPVDPDPVDPDPVDPPGPFDPPDPTTPADPVDPPVDPVDTNGDFCPNYGASDVYRARSNQMMIGPDGDWEVELANAPADTEVLLEDGTYVMTRYAVYMANADITIRSASGNRDAVIIQGQGYGVGSEGLMIAAPGITVADLTMTQIRNHAISMKPEAGASTTYVYNVHLVDNGTQHIKGSAGGDNVGGIVACSAIGYTPEGIQGDYIGAIDLHRSSDWVIRDNYIYGVSGDGSGCEIDIDCGRYSASHPAILIWNESSDFLIERNVIVDSWRGLTLGLGSPFDGAVVRNNFIRQSEPGDAGIECATTCCRHRYSIARHEALPRSRSTRATS